MNLVFFCIIFKIGNLDNFTININSRKNWLFVVILIEILYKLF